MAMVVHQRRMKANDITVHGFGSTFRDWASEATSFPREACEQALAHSIGNNRPLIDVATCSRSGASSWWHGPPPASRNPQTLFRCFNRAEERTSVAKQKRSAKFTGILNVPI